jgi:hypothetical protein
MSALLLAIFLLQQDPGPRSGFEVGAVFLHLDSELGAEEDVIPGGEIAFQFVKTEPDYTIGLRAYYRRWDVTFEEFDQQPADLDGEVDQLGLDLVVTYPVLPPLHLGVEIGGGALRLDHELDDETSAYFSIGAFLRLDLFGGFYVAAGGGPLVAFTEFGRQSDDTDHISWTGRVDLGFQIEF